ncbi:tryptophan--tRNA ligase [Oligoflexia bacterium]|nr:tryptophan--tRNA ligase [Oligoflexia bacterium]
MTDLKRSLTGIRASGNLHLGNYLGCIREAIKLQEQYQCLYFIADMHALTTNKNPELLREQTFDILAAWIAFGLDTEQHLMYRQSDLPMVGEYAWYLSCCTGLGLLQKAHSYKDAVAQSKEVSHGVFAYPVLMAADILMYDSDVVPVGKDQKQHVEMARDMAGAVNAIYGEGTIKLPLPLINEEVMLIPGLDGRKMSKSYGNEIALFIPEKELKKRVMSITTDSTPLEEPKTLEGTLIGQLYGHLATPAQQKDLSARLAEGGMGWGHAKQELYEILSATLKEPRERYFELRKDKEYLEKVFKDGATKAFDIGLPVLNRLRKAVGFKSFPLTRATS